MNIDFPKEYSDILNKYNITKEFNKNKNFLLNLDSIPEFIYGINNEKDWMLAEGKNGLYQFIDSDDNDDDQLSLNEIYKILHNTPYDFIIGYLKEEPKYLAKHPISGKMTEWTPKEAYDICEKLEKRIPGLEPVIAKDAEYSYYYSIHIISGPFPMGESAIAKKFEFSYMYAQDVKGKFPEAEPYIMQDPESAFKYALNVINGRWLEAEPYIATDRFWKYKYDTEFKVKI